MENNSPQTNYWIADMTIPGTRAWMETWQWPEAIDNNIYLIEYDYDEETTKKAQRRNEAFLNIVKEIKAGDFLLLTYGKVIYAYGKVDNPPESDKIAMRRGAFYKIPNYNPARKHLLGDDSEGKWGWHVKVISWKFFAASTVTIKDVTIEPEYKNAKYLPLQKVKGDGKKKKDELDDQCKEFDKKQTVKSWNVMDTTRTFEHIFDKHILGELDVAASVYKYIPFIYFVDILTKKELRMEKVKSWEDPYENFFFNQRFKFKGSSFSMDGHKETVFGQSWTLSDESDAMWRIFSPDKNSVRIKTTIRKLWDVVHNEISNMGEQSSYRPFIGAVKYMTERDMSQWILNEDLVISQLNKPIVKSLFIKRDTFSYEEEVRVIHLFDDISPICKDNHVSYKLNPNEFIDEICLDPRTSKSREDYLRATLIELGVTPTKIVKSDLYHFQPEELTVYSVDREFRNKSPW